MTGNFYNIVPKSKVREIQGDTLQALHDALVNSFGPNGSNTCIIVNNAFPQYTKDGHTILRFINNNGVIEDAIKQDIESITLDVVNSTGDGTTSAIMLSNILFKHFKDVVDGYSNPYAFIRDFKKAVENIKEEIITNGKECTVEDIYDISMISTNGNKDIATNMKNIYEQFGMGVFIDVAIANGKENQLKIYDGLTLDAGYCDPCFVNNAEKTISTLRSPQVYFFEDPVDTVEMITFFDTIINKNILMPIYNQDFGAMVPTVIIAPKLSRDISASMDTLVQVLLQMPANVKVPINIIVNLDRHDIYLDIAKLCGAKTIRKYINPQIQEEDIKAGLAPNLETITEFYGLAEEVISDNMTTKFINPRAKFNEDGSESEIYSVMIANLESLLQKAISEGEKPSIIGILKRRIHAISGNMVEYLVGGITVADRDSERALVEDTVLNCRSAALNGVGYAANYEGLIASEKLAEDTKDKLHTIYDGIHKAYMDISNILYAGVSPDLLTTPSPMEGPFNIATGRYDMKVKSSIMADIAVLDAISKILTLILTCNQVLVPTSQFNVYV